jgi:hypothetical protein
VRGRAWRFNAPSHFALCERACQKSQVSRARPSSRIFYIVKRGLTWGFSSRTGTQVSLSEKCRLPWSAVFKPPAVGSISMKIWS